MSWNATDPDGDSLKFDVYLSDDREKVERKDESVILKANLGTKNLTVHSGLAEGTTYYWKVVAKDGKGAYSESPVWVFKVGAPVVEWEKTYGGSDLDRAKSVVQLDDGDYLVVGVAGSGDGDVAGNYRGGKDVWILKLRESDGEIVWQKLAGELEDDEAESVAKTLDGYVVTGRTRSNDGDFSGNHGDYDVFVLKFSSDGSNVWLFGGKEEDKAYSIVWDGDGYVLVGATEVTVGGGKAFVMKLNEVGEVVWERTIGEDTGELRSVVVVDDGYVVAGFVASNSNISDRDFLVAKFSKDGEIEWMQTFGGDRSDRAYSVIPTLEGSYIAAGETSSGEFEIRGLVDPLILELSENGEIESYKVFRRDSVDRAYSIIQTMEGGYLVVGSLGTSGWILKLNENGEIEWEKSVEGAVAFSAIQSSDGGYVIVGEKEPDDPSRGVRDIWVMKLKYR